MGKGLDALLGDAFSSAAKSAPAGPSAAIDAGPSGRDDLSTRLQNIDDLRQLQAVGDSTRAESGDRIQQVAVEFCQRGRYQPRRVIDEESLQELANSIKTQGVMQPITLRPLQQPAESGARYEIIAGERRWRACQLAGLATVPAIVREISDEDAIALALIENLQRDDLNPMEEAYALDRLQREFELTHQQIADALGKSRAAVSNSLRLLGLEKDVKLMLENGDLEMGHARALLPLPVKQQGQAARDIVDRALTVRQTEALVKQLQAPAAKAAKTETPVDPNIARLQDDLEEKLGVPVQLRHKSSGAGQLLLKYNSLDELDGILAHIK